MRYRSRPRTDLLGTPPLTGTNGLLAVAFRIASFISILQLPTTPIAFTLVRRLIGGEFIECLFKIKAEDMDVTCVVVDKDRVVEKGRRLVRRYLLNWKPC